ncbi:hypothetical protein [Thiopseudomonas acetoxidans]|uniref:Uncharacterized protein n=1 Tax=Thiopseudomonas acetoxidans TaxID=3041622 RepID=A0ABT7SQ71_9GAMM|nr:hypothetical protein [Thiopseudomonas sp. CY1220]MDM7858337.1 hypothetical protein [Thiopseudomonas sp. CY1220]
MDNPLNIMTSIIVLSMIVLIVGYTWRDKAWGPVVVLLGILTMMSSLSYRIVLAVSIP